MIVLDSWAVLCLLHDEPGAARIESAIEADECVMSWINAGEVFYLMARTHSNDVAEDVLTQLQLGVRLELPGVADCRSAARLKARHRISYADAFAAALALAHRAPLWTGDPELLIPDAEWAAVDLRPGA